MVAVAVRQKSQKLNHNKEILTGVLALILVLSLPQGSYDKQTSLNANNEITVELRF